MRFLLVAEGHAGTETLGALSPKIPVQGQRMVPASWSIIGLNPWSVKDARRYTRAIAGLWGEILPQARAASNPIRTRSRSGLRCGYRSRICGKMRLSRHWVAAVEEGGMLTHKHTRVPVRLPEFSNRWRRRSIAPSCVQRVPAHEGERELCPWLHTGPQG